MAMRLLYAKRVKKDLRKLSPDMASRVIAKLEFYADQDDPLKFAELMPNHPLGDLRFRIGSCRAICEVHGDVLLVTAVGYRGQIYR